MRIVGILGLFLVLTGLLPVSASAHFADGRVTRTILLADGVDGATVYLRSPLPFLFGDVIVAATASGQPLESPILSLEIVDGTPRYRLVLGAPANPDDGIARRIEQALGWRQNGRDLAPQLLRYRISADEPTEPFTTEANAVQALRLPGADEDPVFGAAYIEAAYHLPLPVGSGPLEFVSGFPPLPVSQSVEIENLVLDLRGEAILPLTIPGQLDEVVTLEGSSLQSALAFVWQGILHILVGLDHVLLVVCFTLAAANLRRLIWMVTAFTVGHSVTLVAGFLGYVPTSDWFVPAVEATIAASVLYASVAAFRGRADVTPVVAAIGLLHGLGFSFVLGDILGPGAPDLALCLAAFNIGVEIGQLAIVAAVLAVRFALERAAAGSVPAARGATLGAIGLLSAYWVVERSLALV